MPLTVYIEVLSRFSSQQRISSVLLAVKAGSTFVTSAELSVSAVLSMGDDEGLRESFRKAGICCNQTGFQRTFRVLSLLLFWQQWRVTDIPSLNTYQGERTQPICKYLLLFTSCLCCNANHGSAHLSFCCAALSFAYAVGVLAHGLTACWDLVLAVLGT